MCGKSGMNSSSVSITSEDEGQAEGQRPGKVLNGVGGAPATGSGSATASSAKRGNETPEEKLARRKVERKRRKLGKQEARGDLIPGQATPKKVLKQFSQVWERERSFVNQLMSCLPEVRQPGILLEEEERTEEYITQGKHSGRDEAKEKEMTQKFFAKVRRNLESQGMGEPTQRATSYQELKERLHRRIAELAQKPNQQKRDKKLKKKQAKLKEEKSNKGKKLISQSASAAGSTDNAPEVKEEVEEKKTPLKKKPVVKSNGEIVYSKFDFISTSSDTPRMNGGSEVDFRTSKGKLGSAKGTPKPTPEEMLKKVEKHEKKISSLATQGKKSEAVDLAHTQKWENALKRAEGQKIKDDPYLLKKSIKKMEKQKQTTKKKWKERIDRVEKQKEARQQKRQTNIQSRKDDKKKKVKKMMRKKGRIA